MGFDNDLINDDPILIRSTAIRYLDPWRVTTYTKLGKNIYVTYMSGIIIGQTLKTDVVLECSNVNIFFNSNKR